MSALDRRLRYLRPKCRWVWYVLCEGQPVVVEVL